MMVRLYKCGKTSVVKCQDCLGSVSGLVCGLSLFHPKLRPSLVRRHHEGMDRHMLIALSCPIGC